MTKVVYPAQRLTFLGVEIDTVKCELRLPDDRVAELLSLCKETNCKETNLKRKHSKLHLQRLLRKLNWAECVVRPSRLFKPGRKS